MVHWVEDGSLNGSAFHSSVSITVQTPAPM